MKPNGIYELVSPILHKLCNYYIYERNGYKLGYEEFTAEISHLLKNARNTAEKSDALSSAYRKIEFPLIFFLDYTVKESGFSFSQDYVPLAHSYNELSGDDKFFDCLDEAIAGESDPEILNIYYIMLGLGFDGAFKREPAEVVRRMQLCFEKLDDRYSSGYEMVCREMSADMVTETEPSDTPWFLAHKIKILSAIIVVALFSLILNVLSIHANTRPFRKSIMSALEMAAPSRDYLVDDGKELFQAGSDKNRIGYGTVNEKQDLSGIEPEITADSDNKEESSHEFKYDGRTDDREAVGKRTAEKLSGNSTAPAVSDTVREKESK